MNKHARAICIAHVSAAWNARVITDVEGAAGVENEQTTRVSLSAYFTFHLATARAGMLESTANGKEAMEKLGKALARVPVQPWASPLVAFYALCALPSSIADGHTVIREMPHMMHWRTEYLSKNNAPAGPLKDYLVHADAFGDESILNTCPSSLCQDEALWPTLAEWQSIEFMLLRLIQLGALQRSLKRDPALLDLFSYILFFGLVESHVMNDPLRLPVFFLTLATRLPLRRMGYEILFPAFEETAQHRMARLVAASINAVCDEGQGEVCLVFKRPPGYWEQHLLRTQFQRLIENDSTRLHGGLARAIATDGFSSKTFMTMRLREHPAPRSTTSVELQVREQEERIQIKERIIIDLTASSDEADDEMSAAL